MNHTKLNPGKIIVFCMIFLILSCCNSQAFVKHTIDDAFDRVSGIFVCDIDSDGDLDIASGADKADQVIWWENTIIDGGESLLSATYLGADSADGEWPTSVHAVDAQGFVYAVGMTASEDFPTSPGAFDETYNGGDCDVYVTKFSPELNAVIASTFIGGSEHDSARAIWIGNDNSLYIAGNTESENFPVTAGSFDESYNGGVTSPYGSGDIFIVKMNEELTEISAATFAGGSGHDILNKITGDSSGRIIIAGATNSEDFPVTTGAYSEAIHHGGNFGEDVFLAVLDNNLSTMIAATYLGGTADDFCEALVIGNHGGIFVSGWEASHDFPTTSGAYDNEYNGYYYDSFVSKFSDDLTTLQASTYIGGSSWEFVYAMTIDSADNVYITGHTSSTDYPVTAQAYDTTYNSQQGPNNGDDVFVSKLNSDLSILEASTYLGGEKWENAYALIWDSQVGLIISGTTSSLDFPVSSDCIQPDYHGGSKHSGDSFISYMNGNLTHLNASTYLGGSKDDGGQWLTFSNTGNIYLTGLTSSTDFPTTAGAYQSDYQGGSYDVFAALLDKQLTGETPTPSPTATATQSCTSGVSLWMPATHFSPGSLCSCTATFCNNTGSLLEGYPLFVILDVFGVYYFAPGFNSELDNYLAQFPRFPPGETIVEVLPEFSWPEDAGTVDGIFWYAGVTDPEMTEIIGDYDVWEFGWSNIPASTPTPQPDTPTPSPTPLSARFVLVPAGSFEMGSPIDEMCRESDEH